MRKRDAFHYRAQLQEQLVALLGQGGRAVQELADGSEELPDPNDRATVEERRNWALRLRDRDRRLISKIREALARIDAGTFGRCTACERPIPAARLRARPVTDLCIDCKTEAERVER